MENDPLRLISAFPNYQISEGAHEAATPAQAEKGNPEPTADEASSTNYISLLSP